MDEHDDLSQNTESNAFAELCGARDFDMISQRAECATTTEPCELSDIGSDENTPPQHDVMLKTEALTATWCVPMDLSERVPSEGQ